MSEFLITEIHLEHLDSVLAIEQSCHSHPWTLGNFQDALSAGNWTAQLVHSDSKSQSIIGYYVAMTVLEEVHLLNISVAKSAQRRGAASYLLTHLRTLAKLQNKESLWLEVRESNSAARSLYQKQGFQQMGLRSNYYASHNAEREAAILMRLAL